MSAAVKCDLNTRLLLQELEAILSKDEVESGKTSPTLTDLGMTPGTGTKSQATSVGTHGEEEDTDDTTEKEDTVGSFASIVHIVLQFVDIV